jgi:TolA-binding protein
LRVKCNIEDFVISELNLRLKRDDTVIIDDNIARSCNELKNAIRLKQVLVLRFKEHENVIRVESSNDRKQIDYLKSQLEQQKSEISHLIEENNNKNFQVLNKIEKLLLEINTRNVSTTYVIKDKEEKVIGTEENVDIQIPIINKVLDKEVDSNISRTSTQKTKSKVKTKKNVDILKNLKDEHEDEK